MSSANLPVIVIVPGAFGTPQGFERLLPYLIKAGYATHPGSYPSCNPSDPAKVSSPQDIAFLRDNVLLPLLNEHGKDVVIIAHSYGGVVAGGAAKKLAKGTRRDQGQSTGVIGLIYVAGNITFDGESLFTAVGGAYPPFIKVNKVRPTPNNRSHNHRVLIILFPAISGAGCDRTGDGGFVQ
jgi:pimeloyl-ACP methyl ester carboxylesterase